MFTSQFLVFLLGDPVCLYVFFPSFKILCFLYFLGSFPLIQDTVSVIFYFLAVAEPFWFVSLKNLLLSREIRQATLTDLSYGNVRNVTFLIVWSLDVSLGFLKNFRLGMNSSILLFLSLTFNFIPRSGVFLQIPFFQKSHAALAPKPPRCSSPKASRHRDKRVELWRLLFSAYMWRTIYIE